MTEQVAFSVRNRNPDVLTCIANLSNDEVFTPPEFANQMLDLLAASWADAHDGANIWANSSLRFLDPFTKSGVFLREITSRLVRGLKDEIPDLEQRVNHILAHQVFGIGITQLTSLIARRSVYCSKGANGKHSIARSLTTEDGNIWFKSVRIPGSAALSGSSPPTSMASRSKGPPTGGANTAAPARKTLTAPRIWKPTPTRSSTLTTSRLG